MKRAIAPMAAADAAAAAAIGIVGERRFEPPALVMHH
jgi:hypothetical protein